VGRPGELGDKENSVYGDKVDIMFDGEVTRGDSRAIIDAR
jgi:hypothetical protein